MKWLIRKYGAFSQKSSFKKKIPILGVFENNSVLVATVDNFRCHGWRNTHSATRGSGIHAFRCHVQRNASAFRCHVATRPPTPAFVDTWPHAWMWKTALRQQIDTCSKKLHINRCIRGPHSAQLIQNHLETKKKILLTSLKHQDPKKFRSPPTGK